MVVYEYIPTIILFFQLCEIKQLKFQILIYQKDVILLKFHCLNMH